MGVLPQALEIIFEVQKSNEKITRNHLRTLIVTEQHKKTLLGVQEPALVCVQWFVFLSS
jgi:hypothetical protein